MNTLEISDDSFINYVFNSSPKAFKSINVEFESDNPNDLFENLLEIFTKSSIKLFSNNNKNVDLTLLTDDDFILLKSYFNSLVFK